jgi:cell division protein FtsX
MMSSLDQEDRNEISTKQFAFPKQRKEPLEDASHVRNAIARFNQVKGVTDEERDEAWKRIRAAAKKFDVEMDEDDWREVGAGKKGKR